MTEESTQSDSTLEMDSEPWENLKSLAEDRNKEELELEIDRLGAKDTFRSLARLSLDDQQNVIKLLESDTVSDLFEDMPDEQAAALVEGMETADAASIVGEMESDYAADLLGDLGESKAQEIIDALEPEFADQIQSMAKYDDDVAGGLMINEYLAYRRTNTVREVLDDMQENAVKYRGYKVQYAYVVSPRGRLRGVLVLRDLMLQPGNTVVSSIMIPSPESITDFASLEDVEGFFRTHNYLAAPVVDDDEKLVGVITREALEKAVSERAEDHYLKSQGIVGGEEFRSMPLILRSRRRLSWLSMNIVLNIMAASVIAYFEDTLTSVIALAVFLPIISDMSGCSGNQAVAVSMRELTLGLIRPTDFFYVWKQELKTGLVNGIVLGALIAVLAWLWKGNPYLGAVAGGALAINTVVAVSLGGLIPLVLKSFKLDPALASGPILTTVTDLCGFLLLLGLATAVLPNLI